MITIHTHQGKAVEIVLQSELRSPVDMGERVRAYCHIHGSDHQRSLSINRATGWGHCFNAGCQARVLIESWNPTVAARLRARQGMSLVERSRSTSPSPPRQPARPAAWQCEEIARLTDVA